jgi:hypothetical protein
MALSQSGTDSYVQFQQMSQVKPRRVDWLWAGRLALGKLAILEGDPGQGKSLVALDLCARLSTGQPFPDGSACSGPHPSVLLDGEDDLETTTIPRLLAAGANLKRIIHLKPEVNSLGQPLHFPAHMRQLDEVLEKSRARVLVISPVGEVLEPNILGICEQSVRQVLGPLAKLAEKHACAIKLIRHLRKNITPQAIYRGGGSIGFMAACRSGWLVGNDPEVPERRILAQVKNNLAPPQPSLAFEIRTHETGYPVIEWLGSSPWRAGQLLCGVSKPSSRPRRRATELLKEFLADGPKTSREIWKMAVDHGLAERTLRRARKELTLRSLRVGIKGRQVCYWLLPGQQLPPSVETDSDTNDLSEWLDPIVAAFPPSTPIDDL